MSGWGKGGILKKEAKQHVDKTTASGRLIKHQQCASKHTPTCVSLQCFPSKIQMQMPYFRFVAAVVYTCGGANFANVASRCDLYEYT